MQRICWIAAVQAPRRCSTLQKRVEPTLTAARPGDGWRSCLPEICDRHGSNQTQSAAVEGPIRIACGVVKAWKGDTSLCAACTDMAMQSSFCATLQACATLRLKSLTKCHLRFTNLLSTSMAWIT